MSADLDSVGFIDGHSNRPPLDPRKLVGMAGGVAVAAFSSVRWLAKALGCTEAEALQFKINAQHDFDNALAAARRAKSMP